MRVVVKKAMWAMSVVCDSFSKERISACFPFQPSVGVIIVKLCGFGCESHEMLGANTVLALFRGKGTELIIHCVSCVCAQLIDVLVSGAAS